MVGQYIMGSTTLPHRQGQRQSSESITGILQSKGFIIGQLRERVEAEIKTRIAAQLKIEKLSRSRKE
jgi:hypothetical protein